MKNTENLKKYRSMDKEKLISELKKIEKDYIINTLKVKAEKEKNTASVKKAGREIARIKTIINEKYPGENDEK
jgi:ribosomal protein L29